METPELDSEDLELIKRALDHYHKELAPKGQPIPHENLDEAVSVEELCERLGVPGYEFS